ncbi:hypothetical protein SAEN111111_06070 [Saccharibacillus endophyticus]
MEAIQWGIIKIFTLKLKTTPKMYVLKIWISFFKNLGGSKGGRRALDLVIILIVIQTYLKY